MQQATTKTRRAHAAGSALRVFLGTVACLIALSAGHPAAAVAQITRAEAVVYVLDSIDLGGVVVPVVVPEPRPGLADSGPASRPMKAFEALRARSPKAYGATSLRVDSASKATLVIDKVADADQVLAEVFWTLSSLGFTELLAPPYVAGVVTVDKLSYGAHVPVLQPWDLLRFHEQPQVLAQGFVYVAGQPVSAAEATRRLAKGDPALRKSLADAMAGAALRPKVAVLEAIANGTMREAFKLKADDALPALADGSLQVRNSALDAILAAGVKGSKPVLAALEQLVESDTDTELKLRTVKALSKAGISKYDDLLEVEKLRTGTAGEALQAVEKLSKSEQVRIAAPALVGALSHSDTTVRETAFKGLVALQQFELLHKAMDVDTLSARMREQIAMVLVKEGAPGAQDQSLRYLIEKGGVEGALFAAETYGKRGSKTASPLLIDALKHDNQQVRKAAAEALAALKEERGIVPLADGAGQRASDRDFMMAASVQILGSLSLDQVKQFVGSKNQEVRQMAIRALAEFAKGSRPNPSVVAILQQSLKDSDIGIKRSAAYALARLQDDGIARDLAQLREDPDAEVREQVAVALGGASARYEEAAGQLEAMVKDREKRVRIAAIHGLAKRKATSAVPMLAELVRQPDPEVKEAVYAALLTLRTPENSAELRPVFQKGMETRHSPVRLTCIEGLAQETRVADLEALRQAAFDPDKQVRLRAIEVLAASKLPEAMDVLANSFGDQDMDVRAAALEALGAIPHGDLRKQKLTYLKDFIETPDMPEKLKKRAASLQKDVK